MRAKRLYSHVMNPLRSFALKLTILPLLLFSFVTTAHADSICKMALNQSDFVLTQMHLIKNNPELNSILNSTERKERFFEIFTQNLDPNSFFIDRELYISFKNSIIQYPIHSDEFCNLLEQYFVEFLERKEAILNELIASLGSPSAAADIKANIENYKSNTKAFKAKYDSIIKNRAKDKSESIWSLNNYASEIFAAEKNYNESDEDSIKTVLTNIKFAVATNLTQEQFFALITNSAMQSIDIHSEYYGTEETKAFNQRMRSSYQGIGVGLGYTFNGLRIVKIFKGGPIDKSGFFKEGDIITSVNGDTEIAKKSLSDFTNFIKSQSGGIPFKVKRNGVLIGEKEVSLGTVDTKAETISSETVEKSNNLAYIDFNSFYSPSKKQEGSGSAGGIRNELEKADIANSDGLIIDLRNNGGGDVNEVLSILGFFLGQGKMIHLMNADLSQSPLVASTHKIYDKPLVILVNEYSASASEILAGNLKLFNRAIIVGSKNTYGKGISQNIDPVNNYKNLIKYTAESYHLSDGRSPQFTGITSDIVFPRPEGHTIVASEAMNNPLLKDLPQAENFINDQPDKKWITDKQKAEVLAQLKIPLIAMPENQPYFDTEKEQALVLLDQYINILRESETIKEAN